MLVRALGESGRRREREEVLYVNLHLMMDELLLLFLVPRTCHTVLLLPPLQFHLLLLVVPLPIFFAVLILVVLSFHCSVFGLLPAAFSASSSSTFTSTLT